MNIDTTGYYPDNHSSEPESLRSGERKGDSREDTASAVTAESGIEEPVSPVPQPERNKKKYESKDARPLWQTIMDGVSTFLSWVLVPLLMPVYGIMLIFISSYLIYSPFQTKVALTLTVAIINVLIPMALFYLLKVFGVVHDIGLNNRKERLLPYVITILCLTATAVYLKLRMAPDWLVMFYGGGAVAGVINFIVNFRWKISAHTAGIGGLCAILAIIYLDELPTPLCMPMLLTSIVLAGMLGTARVWLGRHTLGQVLCGYLSGVAGVCLMTLLF